MLKGILQMIFIQYITTFIAIYFLINNPNASSISANLTIEIWISIEKDKSEPVSNREKVRIIFAWYECS